MMDVPGFEIVEHRRADIRLGWIPNEEWNFFVGVQNATNPTHSELDEFDNIRRSVIMGASWTP